MVLGSVNLIPESNMSEVVALGLHADRLGYARCWVYDEGLATRDVHVVLTAIGAVTEGIALGPGITNPYTRHPGQTAAAVASLDEVTGGRAFLGIGAGGSLTLDPFGIDRRRPLAAVAESIETMRLLFSGERVDYEGEHVTLRSAELDYARPDTEIWLAGRGPRMLQLGGAAADGVMLDFLHRDAVSDAVALVRRGAESGSRRPRIAYSTAIVTSPADLETVRPHMTYRLVDAPDEIKRRIGLSPTESGKIRSALADGLDRAAELVRDEWIHPFVISGTESDCAESVARLVEQHGVEEFVLPVLDLHGAHAYLEKVAKVLVTS